MAAREYDGYFGRTTIAATVADFYGWDLVVHGSDVARATGSGVVGQRRRGRRPARHRGRLGRGPALGGRVRPRRRGRRRRLGDRPVARPARARPALGTRRLTYLRTPRRAFHESVRTSVSSVRSSRSRRAQTAHLDLEGVHPHERVAPVGEGRLRVEVERPELEQLPSLVVPPQPGERVPADLDGGVPPPCESAGRAPASPRAISSTCCQAAIRPLCPTPRGPAVRTARG